MAELTTKKRAGLRAAVFGLPAQRKYPMNDASHARNALARASQMYNKGKLSSGAKAQIFAKAHRILGTS